MPFLPWLPLEYCLNQLQKQCFNCPISVYPQDGVLQSPVFTSPAPSPGSTVGNAQALHGFPNTFLMQCSTKYYGMARGRKKNLSKHHVVPLTRQCPRTPSLSRKTGHLPPPKVPRNTLGRRTPALLPHSSHGCCSA